jgi:hypothetical protein
LKKGSPDECEGAKVYLAVKRKMVVLLNGPEDLGAMYETMAKSPACEGRPERTEFLIEAAIEYQFAGKVQLAQRIVNNELSGGSTTTERGRALELSSVERFYLLQGSGETRAAAASMKPTIGARIDEALRFLESAQVKPGKETERLIDSLKMIELMSGRDSASAYDVQPNFSNLVRAAVRRATVSAGGAPLQTVPDYVLDAVYQSCENVSSTGTGCEFTSEWRQVETLCRGDAMCRRDAYSRIGATARDANGTSSAKVMEVAYKAYLQAQPSGKDADSANACYK